MFAAEYEPAIPASERPQTHALNHAATGIATFHVPGKKYLFYDVVLLPLFTLFRYVTTSSTLQFQLSIISNKHHGINPTVLALCALFFVSKLQVRNVCPMYTQQQFPNLSWYIYIYTYIYIHTYTYTHITEVLQLLFPAVLDLVEFSLTRCSF